MSCRNSPRPPPKGTVGTKSERPRRWHSQPSLAKGRTAGNVSHCEGRAASERASKRTRRHHIHNTHTFSLAASRQSSKRGYGYARAFSAVTKIQRDKERGAYFYHFKVLKSNSSAGGHCGGDGAPRSSGRRPCGCGSFGRGGWHGAQACASNLSPNRAAARLLLHALSQALEPASSTRKPAPLPSATSHTSAPAPLPPAFPAFPKPPSTPLHPATRDLRRLQIQREKSTATAAN